MLHPKFGCLLHADFLHDLLFNTEGSHNVIRGRVSKQITNGSKTVVVDVIGFLCVSLGSSTVQLHDSLGSRRVYACSEDGFSRQNGDRV
jgi:hypothetical protein